MWQNVGASRRDAQGEPPARPYKTIVPILIASSIRPQIRHAETRNEHPVRDARFPCAYHFEEEDGACVGHDGATILVQHASMKTPS